MKFLSVWTRGPANYVAGSVCAPHFFKSSLPQHWLWEQRVGLSYSLLHPQCWHRESAQEIREDKEQGEAEWRPRTTTTSFPDWGTEGNKTSAGLRKSLCSIAFLPEAAGTFFQAPQACGAANVPCVVCGPFSQPPCAVSAGWSRNPQV